MRLEIYHIDAFAREVFKGNSACVVMMRQPIDADVMLKIAAENGVAETAFILKTPQGYGLRWFTPDIEMDLCGHATLAAAWVMFHFYEKQADTIRFNTCEGVISVVREKESGFSGCTADEANPLYTLDFPCRPGTPAELPAEIYAALSIKPAETYLSRDYLLVYENAAQIREIRIDRNEFDKIDLGVGGVIVSAPGEGEGCDFVSRFFTPRATILEDPVTGSAHCTLVPYWSARLGKTVLSARQLSARGGELYCRLENSRVRISGNAVCFMKGSIEI